MRRVYSSILSAALVITAAACDDEPFGPVVQLELATLAIFDGPYVDVSTSEVAIRVEIMTYGNSCQVDHADQVDVDANARVVTIRPFNRTHGDICTDDIREIPHEVTMRPGGDGEWLVRVIGVDGRGPADPYRTEGPTMQVEVAAVVGSEMSIPIDNPAEEATAP